MNFKIGDLVIVHPNKDGCYVKEVKHESHFVGKVEEVRNSSLYGKIINSDITEFIGTPFGMSKSDLLTINEAIKIGVMYER